MTDDAKRLTWLLRDRARLVRTVGLTCWTQLPAQAQTAFDSFAPILDDAAALIERLDAHTADYNHIYAERDDLKAALSDAQLQLAELRDYHDVGGPAR